MPTQQELLDAVHHVVHDYANLVSSGTMAVAGKHMETQLIPPINTHVGHAFLINCRKMYDFFVKSSINPKHDDIQARHFLSHIKPPLTFNLGTWAMWHDAMNKQLLHVTFARVTKPKKWEGHNENKLFLDEFKEAWKKFRHNLAEPYKSKFKQEIESRLNSEFEGLDLQ